MSFVLDNFYNLPNKCAAFGLATSLGGIPRSKYSRNIGVIIASAARRESLRGERESALRFFRPRQLKV